MKFRKPVSIATGRRTALCAVVLLSVVLLPGCLINHFRHRSESSLPVAPGEQPDRILLQKSLNELRHGRYDTGRLLLQSLINTYPDSEYLSQAKLAIADSYYKQGGISGLTEAEAEYKDFITFFPTAPEAPMAEYRAGMCHFRLIGKANRDSTEAREAEREFKIFLQRYPTNPLMPEVKGRLREVQEILARGDYDIAMFYYTHRAYLASESRLKEIVNKYPNFSQGDDAFWYLGQSLTELRKPREAIPYYDRLLMEFPLSPRVKEAKAQLVAMHAPIPTPTKAMLARAEADAVRHDHRNLIQDAFGAFSSSPNYSTTLHGPVILGSPGQIQAQIAHLDNPKPAPPASSVAAQATTTASLSQGTAVDPKPSAHPSQTDSTPAKQALTSPASKPAAPQVQKKGTFHFFKKLIP